MFYSAFPPEFNSGRMYAGPGSGSLRAAAAAWSGLSAEIQATVVAYSSIIETLASGPWVGPSSQGMVAAVTPYLTWMQATGAQTAETASQAAAAATAYETAFAAHVPPTLIAENRVLLAQLVATNVFGQNTPSIAATEIQYAEMWTQDAIAMDTYAAASAAASRMSPFSEAPQVADADGAASQAAAVAQSGALAGATQSTSSSLAAASNPISDLLQWGANLSTDYTNTINGLLNSLFGPNGAALYTAIFQAIRAPLSFTTQFNDIALLINFPLSQFLKFAPPPGYAALPKDLLGGGFTAPAFGRGTLYNSVTGSMGSAGTLVGKLSIPPSWATATPAIRMVASALSDVGPAVDAAALGQGGLLSSASLAGMLGAAMGAGGPTVVSNGSKNRMQPIKNLEDKQSPEHLKRLVAQIAEKPESVQHHNVDQEGLDSLLEQLAKKPGIHAVHLSKGGKIVPAEAKSS